MTEYTHVERPFLDHLARLGWTVIDRPWDRRVALGSMAFRAEYNSAIPGQPIPGQPIPGQPIPGQPILGRRLP